MKAYKGFNSKLQCTPDNKVYQYEVGKTYEETDANLCKSGFHACEFPLDVFSYYPPADSKYCRVNLDEVSDERKNDSKLCGKKIHIETEIGLKGIIEAGVKFILEKSKDTKINTGDWSAATAEGKESVAIVTGYQSKAKAAIDSWIVLTERDDDYEILDIKAFKIDGDILKPDCFYTLKNGQAIEAK